MSALASSAVRYFPFGLLIIAVDQMTKAWVMAKLMPGESIPIVRGVLHLTYVKNSGVAFGLFAGSNGLALIITVLIAAALVLLTSRLVLTNGSFLIGAVGVLAGALGNLIDRIRIGRVIDFIDFRVWPIFNFADVAIVFGAGLILYGVVIASRRQ
ncbi:MAG TPA: signal peptidase II [Firmicutes bacterium]|nr:signal peptidase II [Bacillota bacterium]HHY97821.1 signal peptidase II [Bacillota bacterium]